MRHMNFGRVSDFAFQISVFCRPPAAAAPALALALLLPAVPLGAMPEQKRYYAHEAVVDAHGVIAPWYRGQNGQLDLRVRIAAETLKRYPWVLPPKSVSPAPEYVFSGAWKISTEGVITIPPINAWANGDLGQRAFYTLTALADYYRYSGDPAAIAHMHVTAETLLDHCLTAPDHAWPNFFISVPTHGKPYGKADPHGFIQLDLVAEVGLGLLRAYQVAGNERWLEACKHWADLLAERRSRDASLPPWNRYANPEDVGWEDTMTGGVAAILEFLDELIRLGYTGKDNAVVAARDAGRAHLRDVLLPRWTAVDAWGHNYWDWACHVQDEITTETAARYLLDHPDAFPTWRTDARNILSLFLNHTSVDPGSRGDVYHGAWAYPESSGCCGRSLWYAPMELAPVFAQYGALAGDPWALELARRQMILATYDVHETGVVEDNIDGGQIVAGDWFKIAHPMALRHALMQIAWQPELFGAGRENHIVRSNAVVKQVLYTQRGVDYNTFDAPENTVTVVRLASRPDSVTAERPTAPPAPLSVRQDLRENGYTLRELPDGDCLVAIRHDGFRHIRVQAAARQQFIGEDAAAFSGAWRAEQPGESPRVAGAPGASAAYAFKGNQVRLIGDAWPDGGLADVILDGQKQLVGIDAWAPKTYPDQVLYYRNGLADGEHQLKIVVRGEKNPLSKGTDLALSGVAVSAAAGPPAFGEGGGPTGPQRMVFGYAGRTDYVDSAGNAWRPGTEFIVRARHVADSVAESWWTERRQMTVLNTPDPELYRYGVHGKDFTVYVTVGPGAYHVRVKLAETRGAAPPQRAMNILLNGAEVASAMDVAATAGGMYRAVDLVFNDVAPMHGVIEIRFTGHEQGEAILQALEVGRGDGGAGAKPMRVAEGKAGKAEPTGAPSLRSRSFEPGVVGASGSLGPHAGGNGWSYLFTGPGTCNVRAESSCAGHPEWGPPAPHSGKEALRIDADGGGGRVLVYQEVGAAPKTTYRASVWVRAADLAGKGFGKTPGDSAGLLIQELDAAGRTVVSHPKSAVTEAGDSREVSLPFTTAADTVRVRFVLDTQIGCPAVEGHVTYDDCGLVKE